MLRKLTVGILSLAVALFAVASVMQADGEDHFDSSLPTISMTEMAFNGETSSPGTAMGNALTLTGAASGALAFNVVNDGTVLHEIRSPLFLAAKEVKVLLYGPDDEFIAEFEATDVLEVELEPGFKATFEVALAGAVAKGYQKDPALSLDYELSCHVAGHYEGGMRALLTLKA